MPLMLQCQVSTARVVEFLKTDPLGGPARHMLVLTVSSCTVFGAAHLLMVRQVFGSLKVHF